MFVEPQQTATARAELHDVFTRIVCHVLVDAIPVAALGERVLPALLQLRNVYYPGWNFLLPAAEGADEPPVHAPAGSARRFLDYFSKLRPNRQREYLNIDDEE